ncbi:MAG: hypothetical protein ABWY48_03230 [Pseudoxanthomonas sp.]
MKLFLLVSLLLVPLILVLLQYRRRRPGGSSDFGAGHSTADYGVGTHANGGDGGNCGDGGGD